MAVNLGFIAFSMLGGAMLVLILLLITRVRPWHYPVRYTEFDYGTRDRTTQLADRGPSGEAGSEFEQEEPEQPEGMWDRVKLGLYTYPKRPSKTR